MMIRKLNLWLLPMFVAGLSAALSNIALAEVYINEIYFNPPALLDMSREYIELRGTPSMPLTNYYLIFVDTLDNSFHTGPAGVVEHIFNLNGNSLGTNGFLTIRQKGNNYAVATGTTSLVNSGTGAGFGSGASSSIGASDINGNGQIESGFTAMLIRNDSGVAPSLNLDLDAGNDGLDVATGQAGWTILDSIGFTEPGEAYAGRYYGTVNFGTEFPDLDPMSLTYFDPSQHMEPGASYVGLGFESEYVGRWGNSTGHTGADWQVASLTNDPGSGFQPGSGMFRISTNGTHPADDGNINTPPPQPPMVSSTQGVPYGTIITTTLGAPNFLSGDYNKDGRVSAADYVVWRNSVGQTGSDVADHPADGNHDYLVNTADFNVWRSHFGQPASFGVGSGTGVTLPEPAGWLLAALASLRALHARKRPAA